jgi:hypothetical protein
MARIEAVMGQKPKNVRFAANLGQSQHVGPRPKAAICSGILPIRRRRDASGKKWWKRSVRFKV